MWWNNEGRQTEKEPLASVLRSNGGGVPETTPKDTTIPWTAKHSKSAVEEKR